MTSSLGEAAEVHGEDAVPSSKSRISAETRQVVRAHVRSMKSESEARTPADQIWGDDVDDWILGPPEIRLYVTKAAVEDSEVAFQRLEALGFGFEVAASPAPVVQVEFGGRIYQGPAAVECFVDVMRQFEAALLAPDPEIDAEIAARAQPEVRQRALAAMDRQTNIARQSLSRILASN